MLQSGGTPCGQGGGQPSIEWEKDFAPSAPDCLFLDEFGVPQPQSLTWITNGVPTTERCDSSGATCIVTAIPGLFGCTVIGRLKTGHRWALQNRQVNGLVNMPELWFQSA